jgi:hypothetical protein
MNAPNTRIAPAKDDADILAAWDRITAAHAALGICPDHTGPGAYSAEQRAHWDTIDAAEEEIRTATAETPQGAEIQLWTGLIHLMNEADAEAAILRRDLAWFDERDDAFDWYERLLLAGLRSLRAQGGAA